jgi:HlyD family secretion protein
VIAIIVPVVLAGIALVATCGRGSRDGAIVASGTVEATEAQLGFPATGRLDSLGVREGDAVTKGQVLARLDAAETAARLEEAKARTDAARAGLDELERGSRREDVARAKAALDAAQERHRDAVRDLERSRTLFDGGAVSREMVDKAEVAARVAESAAAQAGEEYRMLETGPRAERIAQQRAPR